MALEPSLEGAHARQPSVIMFGGGALLVSLTRVFGAGLSATLSDEGAVGSRDLDLSLILLPAGLVLVGRPLPSNLHHLHSIVQVAWRQSCRSLQGDDLLSECGD